VGELLGELGGDDLAGLLSGVGSGGGTEEMFIGMPC